jgi:hypothetical protein
MALIVTTPHRTAGDAELERQIGLTHVGMAHFAATGPFGTSCGQCAFYGYHRTKRDKAGNAGRTIFRRDCCAKYHAFTGKHGRRIPATTESCRYFESKGESK